MNLREFSIQLIQKYLFFGSFYFELLFFFELMWWRFLLVSIILWEHFLNLLSILGWSCFSNWKFHQLLICWDLLTFYAFWLNVNNLTLLQLIFGLSSIQLACCLHFLKLNTAVFRKTFSKALRNDWNKK